VHQVGNLCIVVHLFLKCGLFSEYSCTVLVTCNCSCDGTRMYHLAS